jgi:hypothetical protein
MQDLWDIIKTQNLQIMSIEEREQVQARGIENIFNKITEERNSNSGYWRLLRHTHTHDQKRTSPEHIRVKT